MPLVLSTSYESSGPMLTGVREMFTVTLVADFNLYCGFVNQEASPSTTTAAVA
jgi:hypothetical protein